MDAIKNVRKQFIIGAVEIWLFVANRCSTFKNSFYPDLGKALDRHPKAVPLTLNIGIKVIRYIEQLVRVGRPVGKTIDFIGGRKISHIRFISRFPE